MGAMLSVRMLLSELHAWEWLGILVARMAVGLLFFLSGRGKLFVPERREQMRQTLIEAHVPFPVSTLSSLRQWSLSSDSS
jgi:uncharacterized membrane protein YphA (DoxX/SURF4 family)